MEIRRREGLGKDGTNAERTWNERGTRGAGEPTKKGLVTRVFFDFTVKKLDFTMKSLNLTMNNWDLPMKKNRFHHEIWGFTHEIWDFTMKKLELQEKVGLTVKNEALSVGNLQ